MLPIVFDALTRSWGCTFFIPQFHVPLEHVAAARVWRVAVLIAQIGVIPSERQPSDRGTEDGADSNIFPAVAVVLDTGHGDHESAEDRDEYEKERR